MQTEFEATFWPIDKNEIREKLRQSGADLIASEFLQKRENFFPAKEDRFGWVRVRQENDKITMSYKRLMNEEEIEGQKEICLTVDSYEKAKDFLEILGCERKAYQESLREIWKLDGVEICLDEWPFLEPFVEVEGESEKAVKSVCEKIGFDYSEARFCVVARLYHEKYGISREFFNDKIGKAAFDMENPFL